MSLSGYLEVGLNEQDEIVVNHPDLKPDAEGVGHIVFSAGQARHLADLLYKHANESARLIREKEELAARKAAEAIPVDRTKRCMLSGSPEKADHREIDPVTGMQKDYVVLCPDERRKGFVRPVRRTYIHKVCGTTTTMGMALAETYARDPGFYSGTFCCHCATHRPLLEFFWTGTDEQVGS